MTFKDMNKQQLLSLIITQLETAHRLLLDAAAQSHSAATDAENIPDNKYETLALEASYLAQGQANRAQEIRSALTRFRSMTPSSYDEEMPIRLGALILLEDETGEQRRIFLGPAAGGMKLGTGATETMVITPDSPLGKKLLGKQVGDGFSLRSAGRQRAYEILEIC